MGGHGALTLALKHRSVFRSVSALAPIAAPGEHARGAKAFTGSWAGVAKHGWHTMPARCCAPPIAHSQNGLLIDQGMNDKFLDVQLKPNASKPRAGHQTSH